MSTYNGEHIGGYQMVIVSARDEEEAIEFAPAALESRAGWVPVTAYTAAELRDLANDLCAHSLEPHRSYNLHLAMSDEQVAAWDKDEDEAAMSE